MGGGVRRNMCHSPAEGVRRRWYAELGVPEWSRCWKPPHVLGGLLCGRRVSPEECAIPLPRGRAGGAREVPLFGAALCPGRPPILAEGCAGGVCHSSAERVCQRGCRYWEPPHALGGLLCGRRGAPEVCSIALLKCAPEGVCRRGRAGVEPLLETAACPGRPPLCAEGMRRRGVP